MPDRVPLVAGNWKMHTTVLEGVALAQSVSTLVREGVEVAVLPPFVHLWPVAEVLAGSGVRLGAQDAFWEDAGAFTGEVSPAALSGWCDYVLCGHSERRHTFGEDDATVHRKLARALTHEALRVILAVGETLEQRDDGATHEVVRAQVVQALEGVSAETSERLVLAYEPVWAIGTGRTASPEQAQEVCGWIRGVLGELLGPDQAPTIRIVYGGSVTAANADALFAQPDVDGGLVGGPSLKPDEFGRIIEAAAAARTR